MSWVRENDQLINMETVELIRQVPPTPEQPMYVLRVTFISGRELDLTYDNADQARDARQRILEAIYPLVSV